MIGKLKVVVVQPKPGQIGWLETTVVQPDGDSPGMYHWCHVYGRRRRLTLDGQRTQFLIDVVGGRAWVNGDDADFTPTDDRPVDVERNADDPGFAAGQ